MPKTTEITHDEYIKSLNLSPEDEQKLFEVFNKEDNWKKNKGYVMRQSDYSREMDELRTLRATVEADNADLERYRAELADWQGKTKGELEADAKRVNDMELALKASEQRLKVAARELGLTDEQIMGAQPITPQPRKEESPAFDASEYVSKKDVGQFLRESVKVNAQMLNIMKQHTSLFPDKELDYDELTSEAIQHRMTPSQWWEKKYDIANVKKAREESKWQAQVEEARKEGYIQGRSESGRPSSRPQPSTSALFGADRTKRPDRAVPSGQPEYMQKALKDFYARVDRRNKAEDDLLS